MKKRIIAIIMLLAIALTALSACASKKYAFAGKSYMYTKYIGDATFIINIKEDNTFSYNVGHDNSFYYGTWEYDGEILTLTENVAEDEETITYVNKFSIDGNKLVYINEGSDNFPAITIWNNDTFIDISK